MKHHHMSTKALAASALAFAGFFQTALDTDAAVTVETRDFYRPQDPLGGNKQGIHWHANGESCWLVGEAMGRGMLRLLPAKPAKP